ncbi:Uncharacterized protein C9.08c [Erysiphe neolycopersici]|uniref:Uncharacterized protein C9.08c n=1 Tax=Erysiphe neolycopersici TaxID=212602 RepID=A0A420I3D5_9PEZI|nr:Uncharacterized protein C9.08c [Erysiphe neolycopersici]
MSLLSSFHLDPVSKDTWVQVTTVFQYFPLIAVIQWFVSYYPAGKTSIISRLNLPGKLAWITMEVPGFIIVLYYMCSIPLRNKNINSSLDGRIMLAWNELPAENIVLAALFVIHYVYRAIIGPLLNPSMSPIHISIWCSAIIFQLMNGVSIGGFLAGFGPAITTDISRIEPLKEINLTPIFWQKILSQWRWKLGIIIWLFGFTANIYHDEILRDIRRSLRKEAQNRAQSEKSGLVGEGKEGEKMFKNGNICVKKLYRIPERGLFRYILFPHYLTEWIEWAGWWIAGGYVFFPARTFLINEITTMLPRAIQGWNWYKEKFGKERLGNRKAIIPGVL